MSHISQRISTCVDQLRELAVNLPTPRNRTRLRVRNCIANLRTAAKASKKARIYRRVDIDWEAYIRRSELDKTPRMPPIKAARVFTDYFNRKGYQKHRDCSRCHRDTPPAGTPKTVTSIRPPGTISRWACLGCAVSFLDDLGEEIEAIQDRLYSEWIELREKLKDHHAGRRYQDTEKKKKVWRRHRDKLRREIQEAHMACCMTGLIPESRLRKRTKRQGVFPNRPLEAEVVTAEFANA